MDATSNPFRKTIPFLFSYKHDGGEWDFTVYAYDWEDAKARLSSIKESLKLDGELMTHTPEGQAMLKKMLKGN